MIPAIRGEAEVGGFETKPPHSPATLFTAALIPAAGLLIGWKIFWFLTDDAYIAFRYASNSILGYGYVWNAPPFLPVEGYTSFLWVVLLDVVWRLFGVEPPRSANLLALVFSFLTFGLTGLVVATMRLRRMLEPMRPLLVSLVLLGCVTNRTFLAWTSSGLETAMFNFFYLAWFFLVITGDMAKPRGLAIAALAASLVCLTRPDGLLFVFATVVLVCGFYWKAKETWFENRNLIAPAPLLIVPLHLVWRKVTYGEWLPNTYHAKYLGPWPESGVRYALSFVLEYALWVWIAVLVLFALRWLRMRASHDDTDGTPGPTFARTVAVLTVVAHFAYYTLVIGGDHFEYRVYSQLIPLIMISFVALLNGLSWRPEVCTSVFVVFLLLSLPIPWTHWAKTHRLNTRKETFKMTVLVAPNFPRFARWYAGWFDSLQAWLIDRSVCMRHQEHKVFHALQVAQYPPREIGSLTTADGLPVMFSWTVGVPGWVLPHVNVIDGLGLNDYVVARTPPPPGRRKLMAHSRKPPVDYIESYRPNVEITYGRQEVIPRVEPLTAEAVAQLELEWRARVRMGAVTPRSD